MSEPVKLRAHNQAHCKDCSLAPLCLPLSLNLEDMDALDMEIVVMLNGLDEILADRIYARHAYWNDEILWDRRFVDVVSIADSGHRVVDLSGERKKPANGKTK